MEMIAAASLEAIPPLEGGEGTASPPISITKIDHHSIDVDWSKLESFDSSLCFTLQKRSDNGAVSNIYTGYATKYHIQQLVSGNCYQFKLTQKGARDLSDWITVYTSQAPVSIHDICTSIKHKRTDKLQRVLENEGDSSSSSTISSLDAVNDKQLSPLMEAALGNFIDGVKLLVDPTRDRSLGQIPAASVNYVDPVNHRTALMVACRNGSLKVIEYLSLTLGEMDPPQPVADWSIIDRSGLTALHWLVDPKSSSQVYTTVCIDWIMRHEEELLGFSWGVEERQTQWTVLHRACTRGAPADSVAKLLKVCDVDAVDSNGQTPLMLAVLGGHAKICATLLSIVGSHLANAKSTSPPYRTARELLGSAPSNRRALRELFQQYS